MLLYSAQWVIYIKDKMLKRLVLLRFLDNVSSSSSLWQKEGEEEEKWQQITVVTEWEMWAQVFLFSAVTQNQQKTFTIQIDSGHSVRLGFTEAEGNG